MLRIKIDRKGFTRHLNIIKKHQATLSKIRLPVGTGRSHPPVGILRHNKDTTNNLNQMLRRKIDTKGFTRYLNIIKKHHKIKNIKEESYLISV